ncbi:type I-B CRISPR-associated protein Cas7/Csh2 [Anaerocolumna xylanovorans]|uniref:CRISPR-associated protein Csh2 n=1 Tax=Anaerocolumna xylanovorans DSM 12503 TaxID=1121345 RepID=A0A1M7YD41_9FIRM|nr:type I-B CRISPR-associated protein Cas7/Csh2 [Anaerocolumna xylanovorans]SHO50560.1 CRISPR-associated protein Csh2 [Anaerocolumna xylanovorans DSM 12503]
MSTAKRSEILFLYDITWGNPNGDPNDANKPRIDEETGFNIVTDVRLKRTIRDELIARGHEVLVRDTITEGGFLADAKHRGIDFLPESARAKASKKNEKEKLTGEELEEFKKNVKSCADIRMFGCVLPSDLKNASLQFTGPVQFKMGTSLHPVKLEFIKGTGAFAGADEKNQKTFRQEYLLPYSLINFYGLVNDRAAEITGLTEEDVSLMLNAMWDGTKNLITRTKAGQVPRVLIQVSYKTKDFYIGSLDKKIEFSHNMSGEAVRAISDGKLQLEKLKDCLVSNKEHIDKVVIRIDSEVSADINIKEELEKAGVTVEVMA